MLAQLRNLDRKGISLTEILIGIMVLGIGVISLATLFPLGLLRMKRAVNDVRGTLVAQSGWNEVRVRNVLAPPYGPDATYFSAYPAPWPNFVPTAGPGVPVVIDPLWMVQNGSTIDRFGMADLVNNATGLPPGDGIPDVGVIGGEGLLRVVGGMKIGGGTTMTLELASEIFASPDDLTYGEAERRIVPLQGVAGGTLTPTHGTPFTPGSLFRERRYTWLVVARKVDAGQIYHPGADGLTGTTDDIREDVGPDLVSNLGSLSPTADDPARAWQLVGGTLVERPVPAPVGPFDVTIVAFYSRDFSAREAVYANPLAVNTPVFAKGRNLATLVQQPGVPFPEIPLQSLVMDTTFSSTATGRRNGFVYRVTGKSLNAAASVLTLTLDQEAREDGYVLTVLKGAVAVFEKQSP